MEDLSFVIQKEISLDINNMGDKMNDSIIIKGAKENNLKNIDLKIPRDKLVVITGLSGSRKVFFGV